MDDRDELAVSMEQSLANKFERLYNAEKRKDRKLKVNLPLLKE